MDALEMIVYPHFRYNKEHYLNCYDLITPK